MKMIDTMIKDGLTDAVDGYHMGITAENIARQRPLRARSDIHSRATVEQYDGSIGSADEDP